MRPRIPRELRNGIRLWRVGPVHVAPHKGGGMGLGIASSVRGCGARSRGAIGSTPEIDIARAARRSSMVESLDCEGRWFAGLRR